MDYIHHENNIPDSYFECTLAANPLDHSKIKQETFSSMDQLEGWCPHSKASVLMDLIFILKPDVVVEIGVFGGKSLVPMAFALKENEKGIIYGIDPWDAEQSSKGMDGVNKDFWSGVNHKAILRGLQKKINQFGLQNQIRLVESTSYDAAPIYDIDILHVDGNHSEETSYIDVTKWVPMVKTGGLIIFDDVNWSTTKKATDWLDTQAIKIAEFTGDNIWGIWVKK